MGRSYEGLNRKCIKGKYYDIIEEGILKAFRNLYPHNKITIDYFPENCAYYFHVYINGETFAQQEIPMAIDKQIMVDKYINHIAISLFSNISVDEYEKQFNDYKVENYTWLTDEVNKLVEEYSKQGVIFEDVTIQQGRWRIECYHPEKSPKDPYYNSSYWNKFGSNDKNKQHPDVKRFNRWGYFSITPISSSTAKSTLSKIKGTIKACMKGEK